MFFEIRALLMVSRDDHVIAHVTHVTVVMWFGSFKIMIYRFEKLFRLIKW